MTTFGREIAQSMERDTKEQTRREAVQTWYRENGPLDGVKFAARVWLCSNAYVELMWGSLPKEYRKTERIPARWVTACRKGDVRMRRRYASPEAHRVPREWFRQTYPGKHWLFSRLRSWVQELPGRLFYCEDSGHVTVTRPDSHWFDEESHQWVEYADHWVELDRKTVAGLLWGETLVKYAR